MKVLYISRKFPPSIGGIETYAFQLSKALEKYTDLEVQALRKENDARHGWGSLLGFLLKMMVYIARHGRSFDVIHVTDFVLFPLLVWARIWAPKSRRIVTIHGRDFLFGKGQGIICKIYAVYVAIASKCSKAAHVFIANSAFTAKLANQMGLSPAVPVKLAVKLEGEVLAKTPAKPYLLFWGRVVERKGVGWFIENVLDQLPQEVSLVVVGPIWDSKIGEMIRSNSRVRTENFDVLESLKAEASAIIMPNIQSKDPADVEGFGLVALEAAASPAPLLAARMQGIEDAVIDGKTGFLLPSGDKNEWIEKISEILKWNLEQRTHFMHTARKVLAQTYSWDRVARQTVELYKDVGSS